MANSKWIKGILVISVALNILVVGSVVGFVASGNHLAPQFASSKFSPNLRQTNAMRSLMQGLSRQDRRALGRDLSTAFNDAGLTNDAYAALEVEIIDQISAETYDKAQTIAAFHALYDFNAQRLALLHDKMLTHLEALPAEDRQDFANGFLDKKRKSKR